MDMLQLVYLNLVLFYIEIKFVPFENSHDICIISWVLNTAVGIMNL